MQTFWYTSKTNIQNQEQNASEDTPGKGFRRLE